MRLILMGTGPFAAPTFEDLLNDGQHEVLALFTQPPRPTAKSRSAAISPACQLALGVGLAVEDPANINDAAAVTRLAGYAADLLVVCDYGQILKPPALAAARLGGINLHGSLLPKYRGAAPVQWSLLNGDLETGVTVIHMTPRLDAGPSLVQRRLKIGDSDDAVTLESKLAQLGIEAVREAIKLLDAWDGHSPLGTAQDARQASRAPRFQKSDGAIDWQQPAEVIRNRIRGLKPWPGSYTYWTAPGGSPQRLILDHVVVLGSSTIAGEPGAILAAGAMGIDVLAGDGKIVRIEQLQPAGKRKMSAAEFLRGHNLMEGGRFAGGS